MTLPRLNLLVIRFEELAARLGFDFGDVESILAPVRGQGIEVVIDVKQTQLGLRAVVKDPNDRSVNLVRPTSGEPG